MAEAVARIQRQAGALGAQIRALQRDTDALVRQLERVDPAVGGAARSLERYRRQIRSGAQLSEREREDYGNLAQQIAVRGGQVGQAYLSRVVEMDAPATGPRDLTPAERHLYRQRGYAEAELARARMLKPGTIFVPPAPPRATAAPAPPREPGPAPGGGAPPPPTEAPGPAPPQATAPEPPPREPGPDREGGAPQPSEPLPRPRADDTRRLRADSEQRIRAMDAVEEKQRRLAAQNRFSALSTRELEQEWRDTTRALHEQGRELDQTERQFSRVRRWQELGISSKREDVVADELGGRIRDLRQGLRQFEMERDVLTEVAEQRGMRVEAGQLIPRGGLGGFRRGATAFAAGAGFGAGGLGGAALGTALGTLRVGYALPLAAGLLAARGWRAASEAYGEYATALQRAEHLGRITGRPADAYITEALTAARQTQVLRFADLQASMMILARGVGRPDVQPLLAPAALTGRTVAEQAAAFSELTRLAPSVDPTLSMRILAEFGASAVPRRREPVVVEIETEGQRRARALRERLRAEGRIVEGDQRYPRFGGGFARRGASSHPGGPPPPLTRPPGIPAADLAPLAPRRRARGLPFDTTLAPQFERAIQRLAAAQATPFTRVPPAGLAAQVRAATFLNIPGIDMRGPQGIELAGNLVQALNQFTGAPVAGGAMDDARVLSVMRLRGTPVAERLRRDLDIDISTLPGTLRAIERAPELAQRGFPEIARGMLTALREMFRDPNLLELAFRTRGVSGEAAHLLARGDVGELFGVRPAPVDRERFAEAALAVSARPEAQVLFQRTARGQLVQVETGQAIGQTVAPTIERGLNDIKERLAQVVTEILNEQINQPVEGGLQ